MTKAAYDKIAAGLQDATAGRHDAKAPPDRICGGKPVHALAAHDARTLKLCIAGAWLYGTISRGRASEIAMAMGWKFSEIEDLAFVEERNREHEQSDAGSRANSAGQ